MGSRLAEFVAEREDAFFGARFFFIAACAAHQRIKALFFNGFNQRNGLGGVARIGFAAQDDAAFADGFFDAADHKLYAGTGNRIVAELNDFGVVVAGIDVQEFERQLQRAPRLEALTASASNTTESLPPENNKAGFWALAMTSRMI